MNIYASFSQEVFSEKKSTILKGFAFDATKLENAVKGIAKKYLQDPDASMIDSIPGKEKCKTFVTPLSKVQMLSLLISDLSFVCACLPRRLDTPRLFRTYATDDDLFESQVKIWEAARATSAAPRFFPPIQIGPKNLQEEFVDGALGYNNPTQLLIQEAHAVFGAGKIIDCIVSIGTGRENIIQLPAKPAWYDGLMPKDLIEALKDMATNCQKIHKVVEYEYRNDVGRYHRLNVDQGLASISLEKWDELSDVLTYTRGYLDDNSPVVDSAVKALCTGSLDSL